MNFKPLSNRVLIECLEVIEKTDGGIFIPNTAQETSTNGKVIAVGKGMVTYDGKLQPMEVEVGDLIVFEKYSGINKVLIDGRDYIIIREDEIIGKETKCQTH